MDKLTIAIPEAVSKWIEPMTWALIVLVILWAVLAVLGYLKRRAYNLSAMESARGDALNPDFLKVNKEARKQQIERGKAFSARGKTAQPEPNKILPMARFAGVVVSIATFVTAAAFAMMRIEYVDAAWQSISTWTRFLSIIEAYPVGFAFAIFITLTAFVRLLLSLR